MGLLAVFMWNAQTLQELMRSAFCQNICLCSSPAWAPPSPVGCCLARHSFPMRLRCCKRQRSGAATVCTSRPEESACSARRSHLDVDDDDPTVGQKFSTETLRRGDAGRGPIPSSLHGAPETAEESREVLARLKRMAGFESQDFDPGVRATAAGHLRGARQAAVSGWLAEDLFCLGKLLTTMLLAQSKPQQL